MFLTQVWGTILGCIVNYVVMVSIVTSKRDVLLDPQGTNIWSGQTVQVSAQTERGREDLLITLMGGN